MVDRYSNLLLCIHLKQENYEKKGHAAEKHANLALTNIQLSVIRR